ncbi:MAG TPA: diguanylate cyclase [Planctomycetota bacterium]|jgi:diguanylate cyclase (GGDEF)-like protein|nr:diguanylate cyclase [Planctomycetota bacterium]
MTDPVPIETLFRDASDLFVLLGSDRRVRHANPAMREGVRGARPGVDFLEIVPEGSYARMATELARAAGGATVFLEVELADGVRGGRRVEWRFFPVDGGLVAGLGRFRGEDPAILEQLGRVNEELREKTRILDHIQIELTQVPFIDPVTGVWNRLQVVERLTGEWSRSERYGSPISCLLVQVQGLAEIRARQGPFVGDEVLKAVARRLKRTVRDHDVVGRYGDQRFVLAVVADGDGARALCRRVRQAVSGEPVAVGDRKLQVAVCIGGATNRSEGVEIMEDLFSVAETSLLEAVRTETHPEGGIHVAEEIGV